MSNNFLFSIVIPAFNRAWCISRAVTSAIKFASQFSQVEIIVVDDGSRDESAAIAEAVYRQHPNAEQIGFALIRHEKNRGVCGAKNSGALAAKGKWVVFLDSDDELVPEVAHELYGALLANDRFPLHFFRSIESGEASSSTKLDKDVVHLRDLNALLTVGTGGEALPVVKAEVFRKFLYDEDVNGYESLSYLRIAAAYSYVVVHSTRARRYYTDHADRLSSKAGMKRRYSSICVGHRRVLREHWSSMSVLTRTIQCLRILKSHVLAI